MKNDNHVIYAATSNPGKVADFRTAAANSGIEVAPLPGFDALPECIEDGATFEENARKKAIHYSEGTQELVFADDSGLEVAALGGAPGVHSARYSDPGATDVRNNEKLLRNLASIPTEKRNARFVCVIAVAKAGQVLATFEGFVEGFVAPRAHGSGGFGYDPLFLLPELGCTFGEISREEKLRHSHRGRAFRKLVEWLVIYFSHA